MAKINVLIHDNHRYFDKPFIYSLLKILKYTKLDLTFLFRGGIDVADNKNKLIEASDSDYILFLDTDMSFPENTVDRLYELLQGRYDAATALNTAKVPPYQPILLKRNGDKFKYFFDYPDTPFEIDATGTACMMFKAEFFKTKPKPWFKSDSNDFCLEMCKTHKPRIICDPKLVSKHYNLVGFDINDFYPDIEALKKAAKRENKFPITQI